MILFNNVSKFRECGVDKIKNRVILDILFGIKKKEYEKNKKEDFLLENVSFSLSKGESLLILGAENSGKSMIAKLISGLVQPSNGLVEAHGKVRLVNTSGVGANALSSVREYLFLLSMILGVDTKDLCMTADKILNDCRLKNFEDVKLFDLPRNPFKKMTYYASLIIDADIYIFGNKVKRDESEFGQLCISRIEEIQKTRTAVFIAENIKALPNNIKKVLVLDQGYPLYFGSYDLGVPIYSKFLKK